MEQRQDIDQENASASTGSQHHGATPHVENSLDLMAYINVVLGYWWLIAPLAVLGGVIGFVLCFYSKPMYRANCRYEIYANKGLAVDNQLDPSFSGSANRRDFKPLERHMVHILGKNINKDVKNKLCVRWNIDSKDPLVTDVKLNVEPVRGAQDFMMDISVDSYDDEFSLEYIKLLIETFRDFREDTSSLLHDNSVRNLVTEKNKMEEELYQVQEDIVKFITTRNMVFLENKKESEERHLEHLITLQRELKTQRTILESQNPFVKDVDAATLNSMLELSTFSMSNNAAATDNEFQGADWNPDAEWLDLERAIIQSQAEYDYMLNKYKPDHPIMVDQKEKLDLLQKYLESSQQIQAKQMSTRRKVLEVLEGGLLKAAERIQTSMQLDAQDTAEYENLIARAQHLRELYSQLFDKLIKSSTSIKDPYVSRYVAKPKIERDNDDRPVIVWPKKVVAVPLGMVLVGGFGVAGVIGYFMQQARLYNYDILETVGNVSCLAGIPKVPAHVVKRGRFFLESEPRNSPICESYRLLKASIDKKRNNGKVILVTSLQPGEGKTMTSLNIANVYAWSGMRVLLLDGDLRRVTLRKAFPNAPTHGLIDWMKEVDIDWRQYVVKDVQDNLDYLPGGTPDLSASELLDLDHFRNILEELKNEYDVIIVDSAPVGPIVDTLIMAKHVDSVVLVARTCKTSVPAVNHAINLLKDTNLIGFVQNGVTATSRRFNYYGSEYLGYFPQAFTGYSAGYAGYKSMYGPQEYGYGDNPLEAISPEAEEHEEIADTSDNSRNLQSEEQREV